MSQSEPIAPRRVLLVGANSGIGAESARHLARAGHRLFLVARREKLLEALGRELGSESFAADACDRAAMDAAVAEAGRRLGGIDTLVYSAGAARFRPLESTSPELWREMMGANLDGLFHAVQATLPSLLASGRGHVIGVLSVASRHAFGGSTAYTAAKHGALGLLDSLRAEVRGRGVHVTAVLPGAVDTPLWDAIEGEWDRGRMMRPEQVARVIVSILSESSSGMIEEVRVGPIGGAL
ncbi:MAG: SDR family oxidoreductase [Candidatus Eisenbacteria bacterium]